MSIQHSEFKGQVYVKVARCRHICFLYLCRRSFRTSVQNFISPNKSNLSKVFVLPRYFTQMILCYLAHTHTHTHTTNKLLHAVQTESGKYNMNLKPEQVRKYHNKPLPIFHQIPRWHGSTKKIAGDIFGSHTRRFSR